MEKDILEQLYYRYTRQVYLYLYSLCRNHAMAEDLMQETFLKAFCSMELSGTGVLPWLLTVARNLYLDTWRREKRLTGQGDIEITEGEEEGVLYYFSGLSQEAISRILGLSYGNTRVILYRAKQNLKKMIDEEEI